jgi:Sulfotransferase family
MRLDRGCAASGRADVEAAVPEGPREGPADGPLEGPPEGPKVFVLGSARSGTSILYLALRRVFGLSGPGESHVFPIFVRILHEFWQYREGLVARDANNKKLLAYRLDPKLFRAHLALFIRSFYASQFPTGAWVDKTPGAEAILAASMIMEAFPAAKIIATKRTGVEVVRSFSTKFSSGLEEACNAWAGAMAALHQATEKFPGILVVDQYDIANSPAETAERIATYIGMPEKSAALAEFFAGTEFDRSSTHSWQTRMTLADVDWGERGRRTFERICGSMMQRFDYPM